MSFFFYMACYDLQYTVIVVEAESIITFERNLNAQDLEIYNANVGTLDLLDTSQEEVVQTW